MKYKIYNQDVMEWAEQCQKGKFHALISDTENGYVDLAHKRMEHWTK